MLWLLIHQLLLRHRLLQRQMLQPKQQKEIKQKSQQPLKKGQRLNKLLQDLVNRHSKSQLLLLELANPQVNPLEKHLPELPLVSVVQKKH